MGSRACGATTSAARLADRRPTLFLEPRPCAWLDGSLRTLALGLVEEGMTLFVCIGVGGWPAPGVTRFGGIEGDGDDVSEATPLVWMPGGAGFLGLGMGGGWIGVTVIGAIGQRLVGGTIDGPGSSGPDVANLFGGPVAGSVLATAGLASAVRGSASVASGSGVTTKARGAGRIRSDRRRSQGSRGRLD